MIFLKKVLLQVGHTDNLMMRHLMIGLLVSYRNFRRLVAFHGDVHPASVVAVEEKSWAAGEKKLRKTFQFHKDSKAQSAQVDFFAFRFRLIYHHGNMLSPEEWLRRRLALLESGSRLAAQLTQESWWFRT